MNFPKLTRRPRAQEYVANWQGLDHRPVVPLGRWRDECNLSTDRRPVVSVRKNRKMTSVPVSVTATAVTEGFDATIVSYSYAAVKEAFPNGVTDLLLRFDRMADMWCDEGGTQIISLTDLMTEQPDNGYEMRLTVKGMDKPQHILAACAGEYPIYLDATGKLWCNGNYQSGVFTPKWQITAECSREGASCSGMYDAGWALADKYGPWWQEIGFRYMGSSGWMEDRYHGEPVDLEELYLTYDGPQPQFNDTISIQLWSEIWDAEFESGPRVQMVLIGSYVVVFPFGYYCNVVKLANNEELTEGEDYGRIRQSNGHLPNTDTVLTLCNIDGEPYQGVEAGATEPASTSSLWLDTSGQTTVLREYSVSMTTWVIIPTVYIKIAAKNVAKGLRDGDGVSITTDWLPDGVNIGTPVNADRTPDWPYDPIDPEVSQVLVKVYRDEENDGVGDWILVVGIMNEDELTVQNDGPYVYRDYPFMDFVIECGNRLWGCCYRDYQGNTRNEIYACKLGDFRNWSVYSGLSTDSYTATRGTQGAFTGAAVLDGCPLFFKENTLEKVYPSASGAHQIRTFSLEGVMAGAGESTVVIDGVLYYQGRSGILAYNGTLPKRISDVFGDWVFSGGRAGRHGRKYYIELARGQEYGHDDTRAELALAVYDTESGIWHLEDAPGMAFAYTWQDKLYFGALGSVAGASDPPYERGSVWVIDGQNDHRGVQWYAESGELGLELPEHTFISQIILRYRMELSATMRVFVSYNGGPWMLKGNLNGGRLHSNELNLFPQRVDHFRVRMEGTGGVELYSVGYKVERSQLGHV